MTHKEAREAKEVKEDVRRRLVNVEGQVRGIQRMVEEEKYCVDILIQLSAAKAALDRVSAIILKGHVESCVVDAVESGSEEQKAEKIEELMQIFSKFGGR
jgi:DNA-binding FrmR family transcriptional regulator